ncbi:MAG: multidrug effflux MFS transporter [Pseudomonadota bacterium]
MTEAPEKSSNSSAGVKPPALWMLVALSAVGPLAINIFQPSIGSIADSFGIASSDVQWALTVYLFGLLFGQMIYGPLSDRYGRKPLLYFGLIGFILANTWLALSASFGSLLIGRGLQAFTGCCGIILTRAIVRDCYPTEKSASAYGYITTAMVAVPAVAPALGYSLESLGSWRYSFGFLAVFGFAVLAITLRFVPETNKARLSRLDFGSYRDAGGMLLRSRPFLAYSGVIGFGTASFFSFLNGAPYATIETLGLTGRDFSIYFLILSAGYMGGNFVAGRYALRLGLPRMMHVGHSISLLGTAIFLINLYTPSMITIFTPAAIVAFGGGLYNPASMAGALAVRPDVAGTASSIVGVLSMIIALAMSALVNALLAPNLVGFIVIYSACSVGAALCAYIALWAQPLKTAAA